MSERLDSPEKAKLDWDSLAPLSASAFFQHLQQRHRNEITHVVNIPAMAGKYCPFPMELDTRLRSALTQYGIQRLYSHQAQAWQSLTGGQHTVIVTPTASGKSLCYHLPVLHDVLQGQSKALYLFPTKALSQDQVAEITALNRTVNLGIRAYTFDGDTPGDARKAVRTKGDIVVSNPDMLHQGILPHHTKWAQFFENLKYIVVDELHIYRGVFGSHMANVLQRLQRICAFYGSRPVFILCSATIANPQQLAEQLTGQSVVCIDQSGAPSGEKHIVLWNPPVINADLGIRASARSQITRLAKQAVRYGLKTIVFNQSRLMVEVVTKYLKDTFDKDPRKTPRVHAYRGGYLPTERRQVEKKMRAGEMDCIVTTSALELGVDIGALDVCLLNGYPGTIAGTWQRLGRAGRRQQASLGILVANSQPLDQFVVRNPHFFSGASPEHARIDPLQLLIFLDHLRCAAFELSFRDGETFAEQDIREFLGYLQQEGVLHHEGNQWHWIADAYPANSVSLRSVAEGNFVVIDISQGKQQVIAEVDYNAAPMTIYEEAIYLVQAQPWQVEKLDWQGRKAFVRKTQADYYTDAIDYTKLKILDEFESKSEQNAMAGHGEVHILRRIAGFKKIRYYTHENIGFGKIDLPDQEMHTTAVWWQINPHTIDQWFEHRWQAIDGLLGAAYAMHHVAALLMLSEPRDIGRAVGDGDAQWYATIGPAGRGQVHNDTGEPVSHLPLQFTPTIFLYDNYPGGIGLSRALYLQREDVITQSKQMIERCDCHFGCPTCVGPILSTDETTTRTPKRSALLILDQLHEQ